MVGGRTLERAEVVVVAQELDGLLRDTEDVRVRSMGHKQGGPL